MFQEVFTSSEHVGQGVENGCHSFSSFYIQLYGNEEVHTQELSSSNASFPIIPEESDVHYGSHINYELIKRSKCLLVQKEV